MGGGGALAATPMGCPATFLTGPVRSLGKGASTAGHRCLLTGGAFAGSAETWSKRPGFSLTGLHLAAASFVMP